MLKDVIYTAWVIGTVVILTVLMASVIVEYATRPPRKEDKHNCIKFRSVKYYRKKKAQLK